MGILSPIMSFIVDREPNYPSPSDKIKLNKVIGRYRLLLKTIAWRYDVGEIKFGLADLLVGRNEEGDYKEALKLYDDILKGVASPYLRARALAGKAELMITSNDRSETDEAIKLAESSSNIIKRELNVNDFFYQKAQVVEAELLTKKGTPSDLKLAVKIYDGIIKNEKSNAYFKARAMVGISELKTYSSPLKDLKKFDEYCNSAQVLLAERPNDYFMIKSRVVQAEILTRMNAKKNVNKIISLCNQVIAVKSADTQLVFRAKLDKADVSKPDNALKILKEVKASKDLPPYLAEKAKLVEQAVKSRIKK
jgi:tetratricopeptide (TPR) repeat protein